MLKKLRVGIVALLLVCGIAGCDRGNMYGDGTVTADTVSAATESRYKEGEVTEYEGAKLDPAAGPRDNSIKGIHEVDIANYRLEVVGQVEHPLKLTYDEVLAMEPYERKITLNCVEGWDATILWKGVRIMDLVDLAKVEDKANTVIFHSVDGYTTSLPLQTIKDKELILAYDANGLELPPALGYPFIVVAEDKLGYKWARWVDGIELSDDPEYKGYWEQRGYDNEAVVPESRKN